MEYGTYEFAYHGIGEKLLTFESIMQHGIVSKNYAYNNNVETYKQNGRYAYNGESFISVALPHETTGGGALSQYVLKGGISFKTKPIYINIPQVGGTFTDEGFVSGCIELDQIDGIVVNNSIRNKRISDLTPVSNTSSIDFSDVASNVFYQLQEYVAFSPEQVTQFQSMRNSYESALSETDWKNKCQNIRLQINTFLGNAIERFYQQQLGKEDISVMDVVEHYNQGKFPIYDENDVRMQCKGKAIPSAFYERSLELREKSEVNEFIIPEEVYPDKLDSPFKGSPKARKFFYFIKLEAETKGLTLEDSEKVRYHQNLVKKSRTNHYDRKMDKMER